MAYIHACMNAPVIKTYINVIKKGWLTTFPGLMVEAVQRHLPKSIQTTMGHLHRVHQNLQSRTKITPAMIMNETDEEPKLEPTQQIHNREHHISINIVNFQELNGMISTDQTRRFPITSGQGNTSIMI